MKSNWADQLTALCACIGLIVSSVAISQTTSSLRMTSESLALTKQQLEDEKQRHSESHRWAIQPIVVFQRGKTVIKASRTRPLDLSSTGQLGTLINLGGGPAIATTVEWKFPGGDNKLNAISDVKPDIIIPQATAILSELPNVFSAVKFSETQLIKGEVLIKSRDVEHHFIRSAQPFRLNIEFDQASGETTITFEFDHVELLDWRIVAA